MKFDLTFLLQPSSEKSTSCAKPLNCSMVKSSASSLASSNPVSHSDETDASNDHHTNMMMATSIGTTRSTSIPLPSSHVPRTQSEVQLSIDEEAAEQRDARMFYRLVNGIRERQQHQTNALDAPPRWQHVANSYEQSISRIVQARLTPLAREGARLSDHQERYHQEETKTTVDNPMVSLPQHDPPSHHQDASDAWSISGYEDEIGQGPPYNHQNNFDEEGGDSPEEEGLFEMDL